MSTRRIVVLPAEFLMMHLHVLTKCSPGSLMNECTVWKRDCFTNYVNTANYQVFVL
jgi:hypothetical protein